MSTYESYDRDHATVYSEAREAIGAEFIERFCCTLGPSLDRVALLDAGCGTGTYTAALFDRIGSVVAIDVSPSMLAQARRRLGGAIRSGRVSFHRGSIERLPFADGAFDAVMINQVLHHLEDGSDPEHGAHLRAIGEAFRVLRPGGGLVLNACTHEQIREGFWYYELIPEARERSLRVGASQREIEEMLSTCGFRLEGRRVPVQDVMQGERYFDPEGPLDPRWRRLDSIWALARADEVERAEARVRELSREGTLASFVAQRDARRRRTGQFTFFLARRPDTLEPA